MRMDGATNVVSRQAIVKKFNEVVWGGVVWWGVVCRVMSCGVVWCLCGCSVVMVCDDAL